MLLLSTSSHPLPSPPPPSPFSFLHVAVFKYCIFFFKTIELRVKHVSVLSLVTEIHVFFKIKIKVCCAYQVRWVWQRRCPRQLCCGQRRCRNLNLDELPTWSAASGCHPRSPQSEQHTTCEQGYFIGKHTATSSMKNTHIISCEQYTTPNEQHILYNMNNKNHFKFTQHKKMYT